MKQRAKELDLQKRAQRAGGPKYGTSTGISSSMYSSSSTDSKPDVTPTPITFPSSSPTYVLRDVMRNFHLFVCRSAIRPSASGKAMKLGTKGKNVESFVDQLKSEGETVANTVPVTSGAGGTTGKTKTPSISLPDSQKGE